MKTKSDNFTLCLVLKYISKLRDHKIRTIEPIEAEALIPYFGTKWIFNKIENTAAIPLIIIGFSGNARPIKYE